MLIQRNHRSEYLRILKLAYTLHKRGGVSADACTAFITACTKRDKAAYPILPAPQEHPADILLNSFAWGENQGVDWAGIVSIFNE